MSPPATTSPTRKSPRRPGQGADPAVRRFLAAKVRALTARSRRLAHLGPSAVGIRPQDAPFAPSPNHFRLVNRRLKQLDGEVAAAVGSLRQVSDDPTTAPEHVLATCAVVERQIDRSRRAYGLYYDVFSQRGTRFARPLAACDAIAADCYAVVREALPGVLPADAVEPLTYLEHSQSPATFRRGVMLKRLLGEANPFPLLRVPYDRVESPWGMGVLLHEIGHNLQSDLGIWEPTRLAVLRRVLEATRDPWLARVWARWHKEIFADLAGLLLGGPQAAWAMKDFLAYPAPRVLSFRALGVHPVPYIRAFIMAEMLRRMDLPEEATRIEAVWRRLYDPYVPGRVPPPLLDTAAAIIPLVVDEIAFMPRFGAGWHALADAIPFSVDDDRRIRAAARGLARGQVDPELPPRFLVGASRFALERGLGTPGDISRHVIRHLTADRLQPTAESAA